jgi:hypothetical protein
VRSIFVELRHELSADILDSRHQASIDKLIQPTAELHAISMHFARNHRNQCTNIQNLNPRREVDDHDWDNLCIAAKEVRGHCKELGLHIMMLQPFDNFEGCRSNMPSILGLRSCYGLVSLHLFS